jgi:hypothetical protein
MAATDKAYSERVQAFDKLRAAVDKRPDGPTQVEARLVGKTALVNVPVDKEKANARV